MKAFDEIRLKFASVEPLKYGANAAAEFDDPNWPRFVRITDVDESGRLRDETFRSLPPEIAAPYLLNEGDILLARSGATVGKSFIYKKDWGEACYAGYLIRLRSSNDYDARFIYWYFQSSRYWADIESNLIQSTIQNVSSERYASFKIPCPPLETQRRIAAFLDEKTARIDALIEKKRALLDRLSEKRQALITRAVTKGLNPDTPMKDSGIDWLGDIPAHWEVRGLTKSTNRVDYRGATPEKSPSGVFLVTAKNIKNGKIEYEASREFIPEENYEYVMRRGKPRIGEVLFTTEAPLGEIARVDNEAVALAQRIIKFSSSMLGLSNDYLAYWMGSSCFQRDLLSRATGSTALGIKASKIVELKCLLPPLNEQIQITKFLDADGHKRSSAVKKIAESISQLSEYRAALITAAVTGKLDIPENKVVAFPAKREANDAFKRSVLAAHIADAFCDQPTFGRVKFQKTLHLCEAHLGLEEVGGNYHRRAAGPFDTRMMHSVHSQLKKQGWVEIEQRSNGRGYEYRRGAKLGAYHKYYDRYFGNRDDTIEELLGLLAPMDTQQAEIVSTAYAAWNDLLLDGHDATDDEILHLILNDWADEKRRIPEERWRAALGWMREKGLVPRGEGSHTKRG